MASFFGIRTVVTAVALAIGTWTTLPGPAAAQSCSQPEPANFNGRLGDPANISAATRQAVMDAINAYAWTLDLKDAANFANLFTDSVMYEICTASGELIKRASNKSELVTYITTQPFSFLTSRGLTARHFMTNVVLAAPQKDGDVDALIAMLVTLQPSYLDGPIVDYTATLVATLTREADGRTRISKLLTFTQQPVRITRAR